MKIFSQPAAFSASSWRTEGLVVRGDAGVTDKHRF